MRNVEDSNAIHDDNLIPISLAYPARNFDYGYIYSLKASSRVINTYTHTGYLDKTTFSIVIMGRKTWESIPDNFKPLQNRYNVILSNNENYRLEQNKIYDFPPIDSIEVNSSHLVRKISILRLESLIRRNQNLD